MIYPYYVNEWSANAEYLPIAFAEKVCSIYKIQMVTSDINVSDGFFFHQFNITMMFMYYTCFRHFSFQYYCCCTLLLCYKYIPLINLNIR